MWIWSLGAQLWIDGGYGGDSRGLCGIKISQLILSIAGKQKRATVVSNSRVLCSVSLAFLQESNKFTLFRGTVWYSIVFNMPIWSNLYRTLWTRLRMEFASRAQETLLKTGVATWPCWRPCWPFDPVGSWKNSQSLCWVVPGVFMMFYRVLPSGNFT